MPLVSDYASEGPGGGDAGHDAGEEDEVTGGGTQEFLILGPIWNLSSVGVLAKHLGTLRVSTICHKRKALAFPRF